MTRTATIIAITGAQQGAIARRFAAAGWTVRGTSRTSATAPAGTVIVDPESGTGMSTAMDGADVVVLTLPQDHRAGAMPRLTHAVARAAARAGVGRIVLNTAGSIDEHSDEPLFRDLRAARDAVRDAGVPWTIVQPTVFMDNLLQPWSLAAIVNDGVVGYPAPVEARVSWLSHRSLAEFVLAAAEHPGAGGREFRIGGPEPLTGDQLGAALAARLDRPVAYHRVPLDAFAAGLDQAFGAPAGQRIASIYARLERDGDVMAVTPADHEMLGVVPESFASFVERQSWQL